MADAACEKFPLSRRLLGNVFVTMAINVSITYATLKYAKKLNEVISVLNFINWVYTC